MKKLGYIFLLVSSAVCAWEMFGFFYYDRVLERIHMGECYSVPGGAWRDDMVQVLEVGRFSLKARNLHGEFYRIDRDYAHDLTRVDCFDFFGTHN